jgi:hypothetical protein
MHRHTTAIPNVLHDFSNSATQSLSEQRGSHLGRIRAQQSAQGVVHQQT